MLFWYVPAAHDTGDALPATHMLPAGHSVLALASPPAQMKPASHRRVGRTMPLEGQVRPGGHAKQLASDTPPVALRNVPGGHGVAVALPAGQYDPVGQMTPVTLSTGVAITARVRHTNPALHTSVGAVRPGVAQ